MRDDTFPFKRVILFIFIFMLLVCAMHHLLLYGLRSLRIREYGVWNKILQGDLDSDVLFAGSSRTLVHFDPDIIGNIVNMKCYNIGMDGTELDLQIERLKIYIQYNKKPKVILQGLEIFALKSEKHVYNPQQYIGFLNEKSLYRKLISLDTTFWKHRYVPLYSFATFGIKFTMKAFLKGVLKINNSDVFQKGYSPREEEWNDSFNDFVRMYPKGKTYQIDERAIGNLEIIITYALSNDIPIILVYSPEYIMNHKYTLNRKEIFSVFNKIASKYGVPFWDYSYQKISSQKELFYNSQHLNRRGATEFSRLIGNRLDKWLSGVN